jgi:hypothetical protein
MKTIAPVAAPDHRNAMLAGFALMHPTVPQMCRTA